MKYRAILIPFTLLILSGCDQQDSKNTLSDAQDNTRHTPASVFSTQSVWNGDPEHCHGQDDKCLLDDIKASGSHQAWLAASYLAGKGELGYVSAYRQVGNVGIATIEYPYRANTNDVTLLVPASGEAIPVDNIDQQIADNPVWQAFVKQHPDAAPWAPGTLSNTGQTANGSTFTFSWPVRVCHACEDITTLNMRYQFDTQGKLTTSTLSGLK